MGSLFSAPKTPDVVYVPPVSSVISDEAIAKARAEEEERQRKKKGRAATILTGSVGIEEVAPTEKRELLG